MKGWCGNVSAWWGRRGHLEASGCREQHWHGRGQCRTLGSPSPASLPRPPPALPLPSSVGGEVVSGRHLGLGAGEPHGCLDCVPCCPPTVPLLSSCPAAVPRPPAVPLSPAAPPLSPATPYPPNVPHRADPALAPALQASLAPVSVLRDEALCLRGSGPETACGVLRTRRSWQPSWGLARCPELAGLSAPY